MTLGDSDIGDSGPSEDQLTTDRQRQRRERILHAAVESASTRAYDFVHMRDIARSAKVSLATLYHYFPSKNHLLVWALDRELTRFDDHLSRDLTDLVDRFSRLRVVVGRLTELMEKSQRLTDALSRAYVASNVVAPAEARMIRGRTREVFVHLMTGRAVCDLDRHIADLLTDVWTSEVLALVQGRKTYAEMHHRLVYVIDLLAQSPMTGAAKTRAQQDGWRRAITN